MGQLAGGSTVPGYTGAAHLSQALRQAEPGPGRLEWQLSLAQLQEAFRTSEAIYSPRLYWAEWVCTVQ